MLVRLQKALAAAGVASRRQAEELIAGGRVSVNGHVVREPGTKVDPDDDRLIVDGRPVAVQVPHVYVLLNKPRGYVTTRSDPHAEKTVMVPVATLVQVRDDPALGKKGGELDWVQPVKGSLLGMGAEAQGGNRGTFEGWWGQYVGGGGGANAMPGIADSPFIRPPAMSFSASTWSCGPPKLRSSRSWKGRSQPPVAGSGTHTFFGMPSAPGYVPK